MAIDGGYFAKYAKVQSEMHPSITQEDLISFFEHLSTLLNSGVNLMRALHLSAEQTESVKFQKILRDITAKVAGGSSLYEAISLYPNLFPYQWTQVIRTGEQSGQLAPLLIKLNESIKKSTAVANQVKSAMIYPAIMLCVAVAAIFIMLWKVIPVFAAFFTDFGKKMPPITQFVLDMSNFIQNHGIKVILAGVLFYYAFKKFFHTSFGARQTYSALLAFPVIGDLLVQQSQQRFAGSLALLLNSGMPLLDALKSVTESFRENPIYYDALREAYHKVTTGKDLGTAIGQSGYFTNMTVGMIKMGEESGKLAEVLDVIARYYDDKVMVLTMRATGMLEPVIVIGMGVIVAGMLASVYLPMFQLSGAAS